MGRLSQRTRTMRIINMIDGGEVRTGANCLKGREKTSFRSGSLHTISIHVHFPYPFQVDVDVCTEETINEICLRYQKYNHDANKYIWKRLERPLNMSKTLAENDVPDETEELAELNVRSPPPVLHVYPVT